MSIIVVSSLQYLCYKIKLLLEARNYFIMLKVCLHFDVIENWLKYIHASLIGIKYK